MEKCSMCIQMTQATILNAKKEGRELSKVSFKPLVQMLVQLVL
jgi:molybdopterin-containing oxidoreductase family iron-sulfur binding subunit